MCDWCVTYVEQIAGDDRALATLPRRAGARPAAACPLRRAARGPRPRGWQPVIAYKFLRAGAVGPFSGFPWPVANGGPGDWVAAGDPALCRRGVHACRDPDLPWWPARAVGDRARRSGRRRRAQSVGARGRLLRASSVDPRGTARVCPDMRMARARPGPRGPDRPSGGAALSGSPLAPRSRRCSTFRAARGRRSRGSDQPHDRGRRCARRTQRQPATSANRRPRRRSHRRPRSARRRATLAGRLAPPPTGTGGRSMSTDYDVILIGAGPRANTALARWPTEACALPSSSASSSPASAPTTPASPRRRCCVPARRSTAHATRRERARRSPGRSTSRQALAWRDFIVSDYDDSAQEKWLADNGIDLYRGSGRIAGPGAVAVGDDRLTTAHIVICTGSEPVIPPIPGLRELDGVWTNREVTGLREVPERPARSSAPDRSASRWRRRSRRSAPPSHLVEGMDHVLPREPKAARRRARRGAQRPTAGAALRPARLRASAGRRRVRRLVRRRHGAARRPAARRNRTPAARAGHRPGERRHRGQPARPRG